MQKDRIMAAMDEFNRHPVVHTWSYKLEEVCEAQTWHARRCLDDIGMSAAGGS